MRELKFRAWDKDNNDWFDHAGGELYIELDGVINFGWNGELMDYCTDRIILMQYTGMKDVKGVEIYEGDIVSNEEDTYVVHFGEFTLRQVGFYIRDVHNDETFPFYSLRYEVVGNVYENKDLLED